MTISLVGSTTARAFTGDGFTSSAFDTSGADFIVVSYTATDAAAQTLSDSKGNTWTALTASTGQGKQQRFYYAYNAIVGTGHTFTITGTGNFPTLCIAWYSGVLTSGDPFDQLDLSNDLNTAVTAGPITPSVDNCLIVSGMHGTIGATKGISGGLTIRLDETDGSFGADGGTFADLVQTSAGAVQADWTNSDFWFLESGIASFKPAGGAAGTGVFVRDSGSWVEATAVKVRVAGAWVDATDVKVRDAGVWV